MACYRSSPRFYEVALTTAYRLERARDGLKRRVTRSGEHIWIDLSDMFEDLPTPFHIDGYACSLGSQLFTSLAISLCNPSSLVSHGSCHIFTCILVITTACLSMRPWKRWSSVKTHFSVQQ